MSSDVWVTDAEVGVHSDHQCAHALAHHKHMQIMVHIMVQTLAKCAANPTCTYCLHACLGTASHQ